MRKQRGNGGFIRSGRGNGAIGEQAVPEKDLRKAARKARRTGGLLAVCATLFLLTGIIRIFAGSAALFTREITRFAPPERTGLPAEACGLMAEHIAGYLAGRVSDFQFFLTGTDGERIACFHEYELIHMADCRRLIRLDGTVCLAGLAMAALCAACLLAGGREKRQTRRREAWQGMATALRMMGILAAALLLWAAADFDGLFVTFHRIAFRNDYWLLNPRTDLLIRLMPQEMFMDLGLLGLGCFAAGMGLLWTAAFLLCGKARIPAERSSS